MVHQNSPTVEFWREKIEGNMRRAITEPSMDFRRANTETSVDFRKANTEPLWILGGPILDLSQQIFLKPFLNLNINFYYHCPFITQPRLQTLPLLTPPLCTAGYGGFCSHFYHFWAEIAIFIINVLSLLFLIDQIDLWLL